MKKRMRKCRFAYNHWDGRVNGWFHQWGTTMKYDDREYGIQVTVGIVEEDGGQIHTVYPDDIKFLENPND